MTQDARFFVSRNRDTLTIRNTSDEKQIVNTPVPDMEGVRGWLDEASANVDVSADGRKLAVAGHSWGSVPITILDLTNPKAEAKRIEPGHVINALALNPDGRFVVVVGVDSYDKKEPESLLTVWDTGTGRKIAGFVLPAEGVSAVGFSPNGRMLAVVAAGKLVIVDTVVWKIKAQARTRTRGSSLLLHERQMLAWSPSGRLLATQTADERLAVWDVTKLLEQK